MTNVYRSAVKAVEEATWGNEGHSFTIQEVDHYGNPARNVEPFSHSDIDELMGHAQWVDGSLPGAWWTCSLAE